MIFFSNITEWDISDWIMNLFVIFMIVISSLLIANNYITFKQQTNIFNENNNLYPAINATYNDSSYVCYYLQPEVENKLVWSLRFDLHYWYIYLFSFIFMFVMLSIIYIIMITGVCKN